MEEILAAGRLRMPYRSRSPKAELKTVAGMRAEDVRARAVCLCTLRLQEAGREESDVCLSRQRAQYQPARRGSETGPAFAVAPDGVGARARH